ncbi:hypothetical protein GCM10009730_64490 [Streptomyces albidochromogenes]
MELRSAYLLANEGRVMPEGTAGLVTLSVAIAALIAAIVYGRVTRKRGRRD